MVSLKKHLSTVITTNSIVCCLCFENIGQDFISLFDYVTFDNIEVETNEILTYLLGLEVCKVFTSQVCSSVPNLLIPNYFTNLLVFPFL